MTDARRAAAENAEVAARSSYGRLLSILASQSGDITAAEDALADAFAAALTQWPREGTPANPIGWLLTVARRGQGRTIGRRQTAEAGVALARLLQEERDQAAPSAYGDERLALMFVCTHPAIETDVQAPLMLQTVLGLDAARIGASFLVSSATMGQRLVRAKRKIRDAGIAFVVPDLAEAHARIEGVLAAIYAAYGTAWEDMNGEDDRLSGLAGDAIWLARLLLLLLPGDAEVMGLLSLMLHCEARREARRDSNGAFVPLPSQDVGRWSRPMLMEADALLRAAAAIATPGRYQTEAAIQSLHAHQRMTGEQFTGPLTTLYDLLATFAPTTGIMAARAVAHAEDGDPLGALEQLKHIPSAETYQPWWAARARVCWLAGDEAAACAAARAAAGLTTDPSVRHFLLAGGFRGS